MAHNLDLNAFQLTITKVIQELKSKNQAMEERCRLLESQAEELRRENLDFKTSRQQQMLCIDKLSNQIAMANAKIESIIDVVVMFCTDDESNDEFEEFNADSSYDMNAVLANENQTPKTPQENDQDEVHFRDEENHADHQEPNICSQLVAESAESVQKSLDSDGLNAAANQFEQISQDDPALIQADEEYGEGQDILNESMPEVDDKKVPTQIQADKANTDGQKLLNESFLEAEFKANQQQQLEEDIQGAELNLSNGLKAEHESKGVNEEEQENGDSPSIRDCNSERENDQLLHEEEAEEEESFHECEERTALLKEEADKAEAARLAQEKEEESLRMERMKQEEQARKSQRESAIEAKGLIRAFCRVRPPTKKNAEKASVLYIPAEISDSLTLVDMKGGDRRTKDYRFDHVFPPCASQEQVFDQVQELVESALDGNQVCVMAYGQTGSGKSFTMEGSEEHPGLIPRTAVQIFREISSSRAHDGWRFRVKVSAIEVYNNKIREVLVPEGMTPVERHIFTDNSKTGSIVIKDLTRLEISNPEEILSCFERAMENRCTRATKMNSKSSRSHFAFQIDLCGEREHEKTRGKLVFMDLAGSEALGVAQLGKDSATKEKEGKAIRDSLIALKTFLVNHARGLSDSGCRNFEITRLKSSSSFAFEKVKNEMVKVSAIEMYNNKIMRKIHFLLD
jgi:kinesin family protein C1